MPNNFIIAHSFEELPAASRSRLRTFLDTADSANPYQDPQFFSGRGPGEIDLVMERDGRPVFFALGYENPALSRFLPGVRALIVQKGPVAEDPAAMVSGLQALNEIARKRRLCEIQIGPQISEEASSRECIMLGFRPVASAAPAATLRLNVTCDLDEILMRFQKATRYEVRRAERIGITARRAETEADFLKFYKIYKQRASNKGWVPRTIADFTDLFERIRTAPERGAILLSEYNGDILAGAVFLRAGPRVHYLHGAVAADRAGNLPALHPVLYRAIAWAKEIGCTEFDFGGYGPLGSPSVRRFKEGFGGELFTFGSAYSLALMKLVPRLQQMTRAFRR
jgi:hypothetical protein